MIRVTFIEESASSEELVNSIFPSLDVIWEMSGRIYNALDGANHGYHPLMSKQAADHSAFEQLLIAKLKELRRKTWHHHSKSADAASRASQPEAPKLPPVADGGVRLEFGLLLGGGGTWSGFEKAVAAELAAALKAPPDSVVVRAVAERKIRRKGGGAIEEASARRRSVEAALAVAGLRSPSPVKGGAPSAAEASAAGMVQTVVTVDLLAATTRLIVPAASGRLDVLAAKMAVNRRVDALAEALKILADEARPNPIPGWVEARDATGRPFFVEEATRRTAWALPTAAAPEPPAGPKPPPPPPPGALAIARRMADAPTLKLVDGSDGLRQVGSDGRRVVVAPIHPSTELREVGLSQEQMMSLVKRFTPSKRVGNATPEQIVRKAMTTARTDKCTVGKLASELHYETTASVGDVFCEYAARNSGAILAQFCAILRAIL